jgi:hypothetical protein
MNRNAFLLRMSADGYFGWIRSAGMIKNTNTNEELVDDYANAVTWGPGLDVVFAGASESFSKPLPWYVKPQPAHFDLFMGRMDGNGSVGQGEELVSKYPYEPPERVKFVEMPGGGEFLQTQIPLLLNTTIQSPTYTAAELDCQAREIGAGLAADKVEPGFKDVESASRELLKVGKSGWEYDGTNNLIKVWASAFADIVEQFSNPSWIYSDQASIKVVDYRVLEVTGTPGAWYRGDITLDILLKGIVDRVDFVSPAGGSATKYATELVAGLAGTNDYRNIATAPGVVQRVWEKHNSLLADFIEDAAWAIIGGAISLGIGAALPEEWIGAIIIDNFLSVALSSSQFGADVSSADESVNRSYQVVFKNVLLQAGQRYTVYAYLHGTVTAVSTAIASGVCEMDFWYRHPYISDSEDNDPMQGRGFKLRNVKIDFEKLTDYPPATPSSPSPADETFIDISGSKEAPDFPPLTWTCADPEGGSLVYQLYFGETFPPRLKGEYSFFPKAQLPGKLKPNTNYYWKIIVMDRGKVRTEGPLWKFFTGGLNRAPAFVSSYPSDGEANVLRKSRLLCRFFDPDNDPLTYDVYLGKTSPPPLFIKDLVPTSGSPNFLIGGLDPETTYYWSMKARDNKDGVCEGPVLSFTTASLDSNSPALEPLRLGPPEGATDVPYKNTTLKWSVEDPDGDFLICSPQIYTTQEVWKGTPSGTATCTPAQPSPPRIFLYPSDEYRIYYDFTYTLSQELERNKQYFWRVVTVDTMGNQRGGETIGPIWSFKTKPNTPPDAPTGLSPTGNLVIDRNNVVLSWQCQDADGDSLDYAVELGTEMELKVNLKLPRVAEGYVQTTYNAGTLQPLTNYCWRIIARDGHNGETWSQTFTFRTAN